MRRLQGDNGGGTRGYQNIKRATPRVTYARRWYSFIHPATQWPGAAAGRVFEAVETCVRIN